MKKYLIILFAIVTLHSAAQKQFSVLDWKAESTLNSYLVQQMHVQYDARRKQLATAFLSSRNMQAYAAACRNKIINLLGEQPLKTALHPAVTGTIEEDDYKIEKILFESFPSHHVTANLYLPKTKKPSPAVLLFCGHEDAAKATESYQQTAILFAKNGFVVFVVDPVSQAERYQLTDASGKPLTRGGTTEHTLLNEASNLFGGSTAADELWDNVRALDYLVTRTEVDTARIGCLGNSGGAMQAIYFAGFDSRIKVIAPCSYLATRERTLELTGPADGCAQMPNEGKEQMELADYLIAAAPKPLLILAGRYDFIDYRGTEEAYHELKKVYTVLGQPEKISLFTYKDGHGISQPKREAVVGWFSKWLQGDSGKVHEKKANLKTAAQLQVTSSGQLASGSRTEKNIVDRNMSWYRSWLTARTSLGSIPIKDRLPFIAEQAGINYLDHKIHVENKGIAEQEGIVFHKNILRKDNEPPLPVLQVLPSTAATRVMILCGEEGKAKNVMDTRAIRSLLSTGYAVILCDLRGTGETEDKAEFNDPKYYNREYRNAMLALHIGRSLVGQRTTDLLSVFDMIATDKQLSGLPVEITASGITAIPAMHAMLFSTAAKKLHLAKNIRSYEEILANPTARDWYSYIIPRVLRYYDIPDLEKWIGPANIEYVK